ncbi:MAG: fibrobacter succinogenes major paralogous domain-containing protein [Dysgonamonadaceae bacterium]|nr:fibrobacter succinogenes major paralogous domain-containing protein [Dysgonamonadaceae bacterium]
MNKNKLNNFITVMKKLKLFASCTIVAGLIFLTGCNNEETLIDNGLPPVEKGKLTFVLPTGKQNMTTYAIGDPVIGDSIEYALQNLRIYWFTKISSAASPGTSADYKLYKRFGWGDGTFAGGLTLSPLTVSQSANKTTATISVENITDESRFYIVANVNDSVTTDRLVQSDELRNMTSNITADEFEDIITNVLAQSGDNLRLLSSPIPMTIQKGGSAPGGFIHVDDPTTEGSVIDIYLKRRVARFDIINSEGWSNFHIKNVVISNAQSQGILHDRPFSDAGSIASWKGVTGRKIVDVESIANGPATIGDNDGNNIDDYFDVYTNLKDTAKVATSAFYLYPTTLADGDPDKTEIMLEGVYSGTAPRLYKLSLGGAVNIEANKVYRIKVLRSFDRKLQFKLEVVDWEEADTLKTELPVSAIAKWGKIIPSVGKDSIDLDTVTFKNNVIEFTSSPTNPVTLTIVSEGNNKAGLTGGHVTYVEIMKHEDAVPEIDYEPTDLPLLTNTAIINTSTDITYGTHYTTTHVITLPPTNAPIDVTMEVYDGNNPQQAKYVTLRSINYGKTGYKPIKVGNTLWAPVNVGATLLTSYTDFTDFSISAHGDSITGYHYQWGRNVGFKPTAGNTFPNIINGPVAADSSVVNDTVFIKGSNNDWLSTIDNGRWTGANAQGPCPPGWHVSTRAEIDTVIGAIGGLCAWTGDKAAYSISTVNATGEIIKFPWAGHRQQSGTIANYNATTTGTNETGYIWAADINPALNAVTLSAQRLDLKNKTIINNCARNYGFSVRATRTVRPNP